MLILAGIPCASATVIDFNTPIPSGSIQNRNGEVCPSALSPGWSTGGGGGSASPFAFTFVAEGATNSPGTGPSPSFRDQVPSPSFSFKYVRGNRYQGDAAVAQIAVSGGAESAGQLPAKQTIGMEDEAPDLTKANLSGGNFEGAKFIGFQLIKLDGADFSHANLY